MNRKKAIEAYAQMNKTSLIKWKFLEETHGTTNTMQRKIWNKFIKWLVIKRIKTMLDFQPE